MANLSREDQELLESTRAMAQAISRRIGDILEAAGASPIPEPRPRGLCDTCGIQIGAEVAYFEGKTEPRRYRCVFCASRARAAGEPADTYEMPE